VPSSTAPAAARSARLCASHASLRRKFTKPGGATSGGPKFSESGMRAARSSAISSGLRFSGFASRRAALHW
jgi:hypothetical protein